MPPSQNQILSRLSKADLRLLEPHLVAVDLPVRAQLTATNKRVEHIYFIESGIASVFANGGTGIEVGIVGREGMTGASMIMGNGNRFPHETHIQIAGHGQRISAQLLRKAIKASVQLRAMVMSYVHSFKTQTAQTALINERSKTEERMARWLLMAHDRVNGNELRLTHDFLAVMIGVRGSQVTVGLALKDLERRGLIAHQRSVIAIIDREGLEDASNGTYSAPH